MTDMDRILEIAGKHHFYVIEDAAHKQGGKWRNKMAGTLGDIGSFSLQLSKVLTTGEGGILVTADERLAERLDALRNCGRRPTNTIVDSAGGQYGEIGDFIQSGNYRITEFQAAIFIAQFSRLEKQNMVREKRAHLLDRMLLEIDGITPMKQEERETKKVFFNYAFRFDKKKTGMDPLLFRQKVSQSLGFEVSSCYQPLNNCTLYRPLTKQRHRIDDRFMKAIDPTRFSLPVAEKIYAEEAMTFAHRILLSSEDKIALIAQIIKEVLVE
jgi:L-glutamine:2-deoxy-scyllo-inosose/3-amino-2,3-dideoxy-scyllo-inosose aminotransferase